MDLTFRTPLLDLFARAEIGSLDGTRVYAGLDWFLLDVLILALNTDASVQRLKGPTRPLLGEQERAAMALALEAVDAVTLFDEDTPRELIAAVLPDVLIKGADWAHFIAGREEVEAAGGRVLPLPLEPGYSTTGIVEEILKRPAGTHPL